MKISLKWLFDHIDGDVRQVDVSYLVSQFNLKVAEIENFYQVVLDHKKFTVAKIIKAGLEVEVFSPELNQYLFLSGRSDAQVGSYYFLKQLDLGWTWANGQDFGSLKENLFPALYFASDLHANKWHEQVDLSDYILEVDNKSLTHRPDMWGHRGFAREVAALLDLNLLPEDQFLAQIQVQKYAQEFDGNLENPIKTSIATANCKRFASLYLKNVINLPSNLGMAIRLSRVDMRGISNLVDLTNYVMLDMGQPMHVFDAELLFGRKLIARQAQLGEQLELLGGELIKLNEHDIVMADGHGPVSLAGTKGGAGSGANLNSKALLLEAANFDAAAIRQAAARHKMRTDASARYEKTLDPNQTILALKRFVKLQQVVQPDLILTSQIIDLGLQVLPKQIDLTHAYIEKSLGVQIAPDFVLNILTKLGFGVQYATGLYLVTVPTWRASKDINIAQDIVEEVGRMWGYDQIIPVLPSKTTQPGNLDKVFRIRQIKQHLVCVGMHEVENYPFYDESFLQAIKWQPSKTIEVLNPVSENWRRLVTSLMPHLCKNIQQDGHDSNQLSYFEWGRIWQQTESGVSALETRSLTGVFFQKEPIDFYVYKNYLVNLFALLKLDIIWQKPQEDLPIWYHPYQTALLTYNGHPVGVAGKLGLGWMQNIALGEAFGFELDGEFMLNQAPDNINYKPLSRYQSISLDISLFVPLAVTVAELQLTIQKADMHIYKVELTDSFKKDDWLDKKALTFRYYFVDYEKTLSGAQIAVIQQQVEAAILKNGASVR